MISKTVVKGKIRFRRLKETLLKENLSAQNDVIHGCSIAETSKSEKFGHSYYNVTSKLPKQGFLYFILFLLLKIPCMRDFVNLFYDSKT